MKKVILLIVVLLFCFWNESSSQVIKSYGIKIGGSAANQTWGFPLYSSERTFDTRIGLDAGLFVELFDTPIFSLLAEVHYIQKGMKGNGVLISSVPTPIDNMSNAQRFSYLSVPVLAKIRHELSSFTIYAVAGPRIDFFLDLKSDLIAIDKGSIKKSELGGCFGVGLETNVLSSVKLGLEYRYSPSFQKAMDQLGATIQNRSMEFLFSIGI